jgi:hypothetical protein
MVTIDHNIIVIRLTLLWCFLNKRQIEAMYYHSFQNSTIIFAFDQLHHEFRLNRVLKNRYENHICDKKKISEINNHTLNNHNIFSKICFCDMWLYFGFILYWSLRILILISCIYQIYVIWCRYALNNL